jgi:serine/threonine-protein kinase
MFRSKQTLGKYRIERRLSVGGFAAVYEATDTIEGVRVALKIPFDHLMTKDVLADFRQEVRLAAKLDHPHVLPLKNAQFIDGHFVIVFSLGEQTLADRLLSRMSLRTALDFSEQMLEAVAAAHRQRIIHCDLKPENMILFSGNRLRLTDFGLAKVAMRTIKASGSGTVGYLAPEQAMGKPQFASDVFSLALIIYRMFTGHLPEWPFAWPPPGHDRLAERVHPDMIDLLRRGIEVLPHKRFHDATQMLAAFRRVKARTLRFAAKQMRRTTGADRTKRRDWRTVRRQQFIRQFAKPLEAHHACDRCQGPISETMLACPWCGTARPIHEGTTRFPLHCPRCQRGMKLDWTYCAWCYGPSIGPTTARKYSDKRYQGRCSNPACERKLLMPFMRYCPWCHRKVRRKWKIAGGHDEKCPGCGWGVLGQFWSFCPWCGKPLAKT